MQYGGRAEGAYAHFDLKTSRRQPFFGLTLVVSREGGHPTVPSTSILIYGDDGLREVSLAGSEPARVAEMNEMYNAIVEDRAVFPSGEWGMATLEATVAIYESARQRKEVVLSHQCPVPG